MSPKPKRAKLDVLWIEKKAAEARSLIGLSAEKKVDMIDALKRLVAAGVLFAYKVVDDLQLPSVEAQWNPRHKTITIRRSVAEAAKGGDSRARFTVAHEIGHAYLKHLALRNRRAEGKDFGEMAFIHEKEANRFAAAFLSPSKLATELDAQSPRDLMRIFGLSAPAAEIRLTEMREYSRQVAELTDDRGEEEDQYDVYMRSVLSQAAVYPDSRPRTPEEIAAVMKPGNPWRRYR